jgi:hypothetical protein
MKTLITILISVIFSVSLSFLLFTEKKSDFITFKDIGQIAFDETDKLKIQTFIEKDLEILGSNVIVNAGHETIEFRVGYENKIIISRDRIDILTENLYINNNKYGK